MTPEEMKAARELIDAATPGPWTIRLREDARGRKVIDHRIDEINGPHEHHGGCTYECEGDLKKIVETDGGQYGPEYVDAALIVHMREAYPKALDENRALEDGLAHVARVLALCALTGRQLLSEGQRSVVHQALERAKGLLPGGSLAPTPAPDVDAGQGGP